MSPALAGGFLTTAPPGKSLLYFYILTHSLIFHDCRLNPQSVKSNLGSIFRTLVCLVVRKEISYLLAKPGFFSMYLLILTCQSDEDDGEPVVGLLTSGDVP